MFVFKGEHPAFRKPDFPVKYFQSAKVLNLLQSVASLLSTEQHERKLAREVAT